jgi:hypothetical protein
MRRSIPACAMMLFRARGPDGLRSSRPSPARAGARKGSEDKTSVTGSGQDIGYRFGVSGGPLAFGVLVARDEGWWVMSWGRSEIE